MTRTGEVLTRTGDRRPVGSVLPAGGVLSGIVGASVVDAAGVREVRRMLAGMILPRTTDSGAGTEAGPGGSGPRAQAEWVDLLGELEALKNAVTATQARLAVVLDEATKAGEARQGIRAERQGRGVPNQVGAAL